jgi:pyruvate kinase
VLLLTTEDIVGNAQRVSMSFPQLPQVVKPGDRLFLNDGLVQLVVERVTGKDVCCKVAVGGELRSKKGLNLLGIDLGISAFTDHSRSLAFTAELRQDKLPFHWILNAYWEPLDFELPPLDKGAVHHWW